MNSLILLLNWRTIVTAGTLVSYLYIFAPSLSVAQDARLRSLKQIKQNSVNADSDLKITLERTQCFGTCPVYRITVFGDGRLVYEGFQFVKTKGTHKSKVTSAQIRRLIEAVDKSRYFNLRDSYTNESDGCTSISSDSPSTIINVSYRDISKSVNHNAGCEASKKHHLAFDLDRITWLENEFDAIVSSEQWIGTEQERRLYKPALLLPRSLPLFSTF